ncbi:MAG: SoxR reducing system RseC family protein [Idiomarina sp.]|nr:SoxR reducing system RseC family protein [Idiomarina sp.]
MIRELATITAVDGHRITLATQLKQGCGGCQQQNQCGAGVLAKAFPDRTAEFSLDVNERFVVGDTVEVLLPESAMVRFSLALYLLPLLGLIAGALLGSAIAPNAELVSIGLAGFFAGGVVLGLKRYLRSRDVQIRKMLQVRAVATTEA